MIVTRIDGGLGNQFFQYALGRYLAGRHSTPLLLDISSYQAGPQHGFLLDRFQIEAEIADEATSRRFPPRYRPRPTRRDRWSNWLRFDRLRRLRERPFGFHPHVLRCRDDVYLHGYWQSEKYFPDLRPSLLGQLQLKSPLTQPSQNWADRLRDCCSLAVHVRRGDYVNDAAAKQIYLSLPLDYYRTCIDNFCQRHTQVELFVFSNDPNWCRQAFSNMPRPVHFVDHNSPDNAHEDLVLMSLAAGCVIANSTFSWWAAYLNQRAAPDQIYAPTVWFHPQTLDGSHIVPPSWQRIAP